MLRQQCQEMEAVVMRRHIVVHKGKQYETFAEDFLGRIASMVRIPREEDFGIDFYCHPLIPNGVQIQRVAEFCAVQVKGGDAQLQFGGLKKGKWQGHHFDWLRSQGVPLYLARVDTELTKVELFSLWPLWLNFWHFGIPFKVIVSTLPPVDEPYAFKETTEGTIDPKGQDYGNGRVWHVNVGAPFLALTHGNMRDATFREMALRILRTRITFDRQSLTWFRLGVPFTHQISAWRTNSDQISIERILLWNPTPGMNIEPIGRAAEAVLTALGVHLQWQKNDGASTLIPVLQWLKDQGLLGEIGAGLLEELRKTAAESTS